MLNTHPKPTTWSSTVPVLLFRWTHQVSKQLACCSNPILLSATEHSDGNCGKTSFILDWSVQNASIGRYLVVAQSSLNFYIHFYPIRSSCWWRSRQRRVSSCWRLLKQQRLRRGAWSSDWMCGTSSQTWKADWPLRENGVPGKKKKQWREQVRKRKTCEGEASEYKPRCKCPNIL